ncbi:hypothetical protein KOR42_04080 [Thalassoglobus neptunius]|uniref:Integrase catalytic domain-containing protein n=2 Tax=Thalassoglobus neptunius TaxID=1938619 RepID=A0A5C5X2J3_9PLAN|nr:integrase core domain-containing protein [Thalassoglobus neptunius]TWT57050.1 hypothetical protein KOR42_04080 [Thalassoglobus neptunius]
MTKRRRRKPEQIVKLLQEGQAMLAAGKSLAEVLQKLIQDWRMTYNHRRPHSSLGGLTPAEFSTQCASVPEKVPPTAPPSPPLQHTDLLT